VKKYHGHIYYLGFIALTICTAGVIAFSSFKADFDEKSASESTELSLDDNSPKSVLDTLALIEEPCYEYRSLERNCSGDTSKDVIVKTVVKVEQPDGHYKELDEGSVKSLLPNSSINLMIEKYKIERRRNNDSTSFFVTVESFNTILEKNNRTEFISPAGYDESTSLTDQQWEMIKTQKAQELLVKSCKDQKFAL
jgi:adenylate kinase